LDLKLSPLDHLHRAAGARLTGFGGWQLPLRFGSELAEHHAVRSAAGLFDLSHMAQIELHGPGAGCGLDYALLGKHSDMPLGRASYSMMLTHEAGIIDDLIVYRLGEEHYYIIANAGNRETVVAELRRRLIGFQTTIDDVTLERALIAVQGPASLEIVEDAGFLDAAELGYYRAKATFWGGQPVVLARTGYTGETGFEVCVSRAIAVALWEALLEAGATKGLVPAGLAARDTLRLEAGMPLYGHELDRETSPIEGGQAAFIRQKDSDYIGRVALEERPVTKRLVGLVSDGRRAARAGYRLMIDGHDRGWVTSGALSPTLGYPVALAFITGDKVAAGQIVSVDIRGQLADYKVVELPFYSKEKK
jgi:aminomethyltransferase